MDEKPTLKGAWASDVTRLNFCGPSHICNCWCWRCQIFYTSRTYEVL